MPDSFMPPKGVRRSRKEPFIDPDDAGLHLPRDPVSAAHVPRPDRRRQTIVAVVGQLDRLGFGVEGGDVADGAEDLFAHAASVVTQAGQDGGLNEGALIQRTAE